MQLLGQLLEGAGQGQHVMCEAGTIISALLLWPPLLSSKHFARLERFLFLAGNIHTWLRSLFSRIENLGAICCKSNLPDLLSAEQEVILYLDVFIQGSRLV